MSDRPIRHAAPLALLASLSGLTAAAIVLPVSQAHAIPVFDSANYAQNLLVAARTLQQINNQIRSLQNEASMLVNQAKNLARIDFPELERLRTRLAEIDRLLGEAQGVGFRLDTLDTRFRQLFPREFDLLQTIDQRVAAARARLEAGRAALRQTLGVQAQVVATIREDADLLGDIVRRSQGAEGALAASQATNQLLALSAKQQFQLQQMLAAQFHSDAVERARAQQEREEARAAARRFLGTGRAYTPPAP